jgi:hypothetical protein
MNYQEERLTSSVLTRFIFTPNGGVRDGDEPPPSNRGYLFVPLGVGDLGLRPAGCRTDRGPESTRIRFEEYSEEGDGNPAALIQLGRDYKIVAEVQNSGSSACYGLSADFFVWDHTQAVPGGTLDVFSWFSSAPGQVLMGDSATVIKSGKWSPRAGLWPNAGAVINSHGSGAVLVQVSDIISDPMIASADPNCSDDGIHIPNDHHLAWRSFPIG